MKIYISIFLLAFTLQISAQDNNQKAHQKDFFGQAFYESKTTVDIDAFDGGNEIPEAMKKMVMNQMKSALEKTYVLTFNKDESIYKEEEKLDAGPVNPGFKMMMGSFIPGAQYKNIKTGEMIEENEFFGKQFLVTDSIQTLDWKKTKESKQIGAYIVFKATAMKKVDANDFSMARPKKKKSASDEKQNEAEAKQDSTKLEDPMDRIEIPEEVEVTAWFTPQIPVSNGPGEYAGLPGLILELNVYRTSLLCSKIVMNPKNADNIEPPKKGKKVTREEYIKIVKDKTEELRENFQNRGGRRGGF
ncbi:GLPGLI family protein [Aequorivita marina]|uniref:GLPGLI family protein n=1 Tax=Aequorivita marina TaxID=3073654 RepID=UPI002874F481|nr:GLPGLI family protein [Aequorivita sp. S2608]MDS1297257.1 GLPGLI family protein [Aequorivita sp. S2608]